MDTEKRPTLSETREVMRGNLLLLREYARRAVAQGDDTLASLADLKDQLVSDYFAQGSALKLTERDLVVLLYKGILD